MPVAPDTADTGKRDSSAWPSFKLPKWLSKQSPTVEVAAVVAPESPHFRGHDHIDFFWGYADPDEDLGEPFEPKAELAALMAQEPYVNESDRRQLMTEQERQFLDFTPWKERKPLAPKSALLCPRPLSYTERSAVEVADCLVGVKLKPALEKKVRELEKGARRVAFGPDGKMKTVKQ